MQSHASFIFPATLVPVHRHSVSTTFGPTQHAVLPNWRRCTMLINTPSTARNKVSTHAVALVKEIVSELREHRNKIILLFYKTLFERYPSVKPMFDIDRQAGGAMRDEGVPAQVAALGRTVLTFAQNVDNIEPLERALRPIMHKHVARGVEAPHYDAVGECLLLAMRDTLGPSVITLDVEAAWTEAYSVLATVFVDGEVEIEHDMAERAGFHGFVAMRVIDLEAGEEGTVTLSVVPVAGDVPASVERGQFVAVDLELPDGTHTMTSVSVSRASDPAALVLALPKTRGVAGGVLRAFRVGDELRVSMPCGASTK